MLLLVPVGDVTARACWRCYCSRPLALFPFAPVGGVTSSTPVAIRPVCHSFLSFVTLSVPCDTLRCAPPNVIRQRLFPRLSGILVRSVSFRRSVIVPSFCRSGYLYLVGRSRRYFRYLRVAVSCPFSLCSSISYPVLGRCFGRLASLLTSSVVLYCRYCRQRLPTRRGVSHRVCALVFTLPSRLSARFYSCSWALFPAALSALFRSRLLFPFAPIGVVSVRPLALFRTRL